MTTTATQVETITQINTSTNVFSTFFDSSVIAENLVSSPDEYRVALTRAGHSHELVEDVIEGLADSPLYE